MGTNYYAVRTRPTMCEPIHIGKSSAGWMFLFREQHEMWNDPPVIWHSFTELNNWLKEYVVEKKLYAILNEYDEEISYEEFIKMVERKQVLDKNNEENFCYCKNIGGYRFADNEFC